MLVFYLEDAIKHHLLRSSDKKILGNIATSQIKNSSRKRLLGVDIHFKLSFKNHMNEIHARVSPFLN